MKHINLVVCEDRTLTNNTIVVSEKIFEQIAQEKAELIRNPIIGCKSVNEVNIQKSDDIDDNLCKVSVDIASRLGIDFSGDSINIINLDKEGEDI